MARDAAPSCAGTSVVAQRIGVDPSHRCLENVAGGRARLSLSAALSSLAAA
jgi:hypothetical protein